MSTRVTVITPTLERRAVKLKRASDSLYAQTFQEWEHLVIHNDGSLRRWPTWTDNIRTHHLRLGQPHPTPGHWNRVLGGLLAETEYIAYLDDDNTWRPRHLEVLVKALDATPGDGFAYSKMQYMEGDVRAGQILGDGNIHVTGALNYIDASMIVHRTELLRNIATWVPHMAPPQLRYALDGFLVQKWLDAGVRYSWVNEVTVDYSGVGFYVDGGGARDISIDGVETVHGQFVSLSDALRLKGGRSNG